MKRTILVVEDDDSVRDFILVALKSADYEVLSAALQPVVEHVSS